MPRSTTPDPALGRALRTMRDDRGMSREALAFASGVSTGAIARIELGQASPSFETVCSLLHGMGATLADLGKRLER